MGTPSQVCIDGKWKLCRPSDFGCLGLREVFEAEPAPGRLPCRLLLRRRGWPQPGGVDVILGKRECPDKVKGLGLRKVSEKVYPVVQEPAKAGASAKAKACPMYEQDVSGLVPLFEAVKEAVEKGHPGRVWILYYKACEALDQLGKARGGPEVPLQCPPGLAVDADGKIIPLDAEFQVEKGAPANSDAGKMYTSWFGNEGAKGCARPETASHLHARALQKYFQHVLGVLQTAQPAAAQREVAKLRHTVAQIPVQGGLTETEEWIRQVADRDWGINLDEFASDEYDVVPVEEPPARVAAVEAVPAVAPPRRRRKLLLFSLLLNLLLLLLLILLRWGPLAPARAAQDASLAGSDEGFVVEPIHIGNVFFSSYGIVFLPPGTLDVKVQPTLEELFPGQVQFVSRSGAVQAELRKKQRQQMIADLKDGVVSYQACRRF